MGDSENEANQTQGQPGGEPPPAELPEDAAGSGLDPAPTPGTLGHFRTRSLLTLPSGTFLTPPLVLGASKGPPPSPWEGGRVPERRGWEGAQLGHIWWEC